MHSVGNQIGVGKESGAFATSPFQSEFKILLDIYIVANSCGREMVLKLHRFVFTNENRGCTRD